MAIELSCHMASDEINKNKTQYHHPLCKEEHSLR
jgi:hypothetical protein